MVGMVPTMPLRPKRLRSLQRRMGPTAGEGEDIMNRTILIVTLSVLFLTTNTPVWSEEGGRAVKGGATTTVAGGTGAPSFTPVITKLTFHWRDGQGHFECLALAPSAAAGKPGSGNFDTNVMYVTGAITAVQINGSVATLTGSATVTGLGAGTNLPFTATAERGGPGATFVLIISGLTFDETILEGQISF
jgi:hypothetical protein